MTEKPEKITDFNRKIGYRPHQYRMFSKSGLYSCVRQTVKNKSAIHTEQIVFVSRNLWILVIKLLWYYLAYIWILNIIENCLVATAMLLISLVFHCRFGHKYRFYWLLAGLWVGDWGLQKFLVDFRVTYLGSGSSVRAYRVRVTPDVGRPPMGPKPVTIITEYNN